ncbi:hypothetical protein LT493_32050 [Streptomyces tricolor]|nr:hypothetical protein [Streptomyces tricolor]
MASLPDPVSAAQAVLDASARPGWDHPGRRGQPRHGADRPRRAAARMACCAAG